MNASLEDFVERARAVEIAEAAERIGLRFRGRGAEHPQPCPISGGKDRFSFNTERNVWNCRGCGAGGKDAIGMAAHCEDLELRQRSGFLLACAVVLGEPVPEGGERESDEDRDRRIQRRAERQAEAERHRRDRDAEAEGYRERERGKARGIYHSARWIDAGGPSVVRSYLARRGVELPPRHHLRLAADLTFWHGQDGREKSPAALHAGPAIVAAIVDPARKVVGCHITWIDLGKPPKFRPDIADPATGEILPAKKMRGSKRGGLIPIAGHSSALRWAGGEGIENVLAFAGWEGFRDDTFYFSAGDLGNLAGPADPASRFRHPTLTALDKWGKHRPVFVAGAEPRPGQSADDAVWIGDHITELVLLADGDSEPVMTAAAMARARKRHARPGRVTCIFWPQAGKDFSSMGMGAL